MKENVAFTDRLIRELQDHPCGTGGTASFFRLAATQYLLKLGRLWLDEARGIFWVKPPGEAPSQVVAWIPPLPLDREAHA